MLSSSKLIREAPLVARFRRVRPDAATLFTHALSVVWECVCVLVWRGPIWRRRVDVVASLPHFAREENSIALPSHHRAASAPLLVSHRGRHVRLHAELLQLRTQHLHARGQ